MLIWFKLKRKLPNFLTRILLPSNICATLHLDRSGVGHACSSSWPYNTALQLASSCRRLTPRRPPYNILRVTLEAPVRPPACNSALLRALAAASSATSGSIAPNSSTSVSFCVAPPCNIRSTPFEAPTMLWVRAKRRGCAQGSKPRRHRRRCRRWELVRPRAIERGRGGVAEMCGERTCGTGSWDGKRSCGVRTRMS